MPPRTALRRPHPHTFFSPPRGCLLRRVRLSVPHANARCLANAALSAVLVNESTPFRRGFLRLVLIVAPSTPFPTFSDGPCNAFPPSSSPSSHACFPTVGGVTAASRMVFISWKNGAVRGQGLLPPGGRCHLEADVGDHHPVPHSPRAAPPRSAAFRPRRVDARGVKRCQMLRRGLSKSVCGVYFAAGTCVYDSLPRAVFQTTPCPAPFLLGPWPTRVAATYATSRPGSPVC